jgi:ribose 5-phosphate isomerase A
MGHDCVLRRDGDRPVLTDNGNHILDLHLTRIADPTLLALRLNQIPGVVENGLFIGICDTVVIGHGDGRVEVRDQASGAVTEDATALPPVGNIFDGGAE